MINASHVVALTEVTKQFGDSVVVDRLDLHVDAGECVALLGPNGAGKTTTINMLLGLTIPTAGHIHVFDRDIRQDLVAIKRRTGVTPQVDNLDSDLTVYENLLTYASYFGIRHGDAAVKADELLDFFQLKNRKTDVITRLSGGQRRRILIARALINNPELLIMDEPTIGLDPQARLLIWQRLSELKAQGMTMLLTSHYMEEVQQLADRVVIMEKGRKIVSGKVAQLIQEVVGSEVYEVSDDVEALSVLKSRLESCDISVEMRASRLLIFTKVPCPELEHALTAFKIFMKRPASLEDLFLRLTGQSLVE